MHRSTRLGDVARASGLQVAQRSLVAQLKAWRGQLGEREYEILLDLHRGWLETEIAGCRRVVSLAERAT